MSTTIPNKITWPKGTRAQIQPGKTIPPVTMPMETLDFTSKKIRWVDDPNGQTLSVGGLIPGSFLIMGTGAKTAYNPAWQEQDARAAFLAQLGMTAPPA